MAISAASFLLYEEFLQGISGTDNIGKLVTQISQKSFLFYAFEIFNTSVIQAFRETVKTKIIDPSSSFVIDVL